jgi:hypothetical protein
MPNFLEKIHGSGLLPTIGYTFEELHKQILVIGIL